MVYRWFASDSAYTPNVFNTLNLTTCGEITKSLRTPTYSIVLAVCVVYKEATRSQPFGFIGHVWTRRRSQTGKR